MGNFPFRNSVHPLHSASSGHADLPHCPPPPARSVPSCQALPGCTPIISIPPLIPHSLLSRASNFILPSNMPYPHAKFNMPKTELSKLPDVSCLARPPTPQRFIVSPTILVENPEVPSTWLSSRASINTPPRSMLTAFRHPLPKTIEPLNHQSTTV